MTHFDLQTLLPALLQVEDRTSMAVSLESRVPLLDYRIAELLASMPPIIKYKGGRSKHIFRQVVQHVVPPEILQRTDKMGFPVPLNVWYQQEPVRSFVRETLLSARARSRGIFETARIEPLLDSEQAYGRGIWGLLCLELWMQAFFDG
jgi:asparagine synthase (glutamine-hydrolysing)